MPDPTLHARLEGALIGLLVGDALGVPYEFHPPTAIPPIHAIEFDPPAGFDRAHRGVPPGTWSDDGAQALCLLDSLLACGRLDTDDLGRRLLRWYDNGYLAVDGIVFDVGITTGEAIRMIAGGTRGRLAGPNGEYDNGNGSLMRTLPLALWHRGSDEELVHDAEEQSRVTHGHRRSRVCCALYALWGRRIIEGAPEPWDSAVASLRGIYTSDEEGTMELEWSIRPDDREKGRGSGYVVDALRSARWATEQGSYEDVVRGAIRLGNDTDTTACIAGGIAGLRDGIDAIPGRWREHLRGRDLVAPLLDSLLALHG
jgi:ADP-ribosylglycohydrolase